MTVNIALVTSEALVLGCDSVASTFQPFLDPFSVEWEEDGDGNFVQDDEGRFHLRFGFNDLSPIVTSAWGGVTKMFPIYPEPSPVVAVTAGLALLQDRTIASHAEEFFRRHSVARKPRGKKKGRTRELVNVEPICNAFLRFMRRRYLAHYRGSKRPEHLWDGPEFLVGGIGRDDAFPSLYRVLVKENLVLCHFPPGRSGIAWNGQADAVQRQIRGYDGALRAHVEEAVTDAIRAHGARLQEYIADLINGLLDDLQRDLPEGFNVEVPEPEGVSLGWDRFEANIDYQNLPLQEAVNLVSSMVMSQASSARFGRGIATVGGRTHIGVVTKAKGFRALNEPELQHRFTGLSDDV